MDSKTLIFSALVLSLLAVSFASATVDVATSYSSTASHNSQVTVTFNISFTGTINSSTFNFSKSSTDIGSWTTLPGLTVVDNATTATGLTAVLTIPKYASGTVHAYLYADGTSNNNHNESITITITNSPALDITNVQSITEAHNGTINITNTGNIALSNVVLTSTGENNVSFSSNNLVLPAGASQSVAVNALFDIMKLDVGDHEVKITAMDSSAGINDTLNYNVARDFCDEGDVNTSEISISDLSDESSSEDEWHWVPLQDIEIQVKVTNNMDEDNEFVVELAIYDTVDDEYVDIGDGENYLEQTLSINEDDSERAIFEFRLPADLAKADGRYVMFVKAYLDTEEENYCRSYAAKDVPSSSVDDIYIKKQTHDVAIDDIEVSPELVVQAGDTVTISARAFNIGTKDEKNVRVELTNAKLGLDLEAETFDVDIGESEPVDFSFVVPYTAENGAYVLKMVSYFDYDDNDDIYSDHSDSFDIKITVAGGIENTTKPVANLAGIKAALESEAKAGGEMVVKVTLTNLASNKTTFVFGVSGYDSWAELSSISDRIVTLNKGESKEVEVKFNVNEDAEGEQTFTIESRAGDKIDSKEVAVSFAEKSLFSSLKNSFGSKTILWVIGLINLVLIILIIYLAIRIFRK